MSRGDKIGFAAAAAGLVFFINAAMWGCGPSKLVEPGTYTTQGVVLVDEGEHADGQCIIWGSDDGRQQTLCFDNSQPLPLWKDLHCRLNFHEVVKDGQIQARYRFDSLTFK